MYLNHLQNKKIKNKNIKIFTGIDTQHEYIFFLFFFKYLSLKDDRLFYS